MTHTHPDPSSDTGDVQKAQHKATNPEANPKLNPKANPKAIFNTNLQVNPKANAKSNPKASHTSIALISTDRFTACENAILIIIIII